MLELGIPVIFLILGIVMVAFRKPYLKFMSRFSIAWIFGSKFKKVYHKFTEVSILISGIFFTILATMAIYFFFKRNVENHILNILILIIVVIFVILISKKLGKLNS